MHVLNMGWKFYMLLILSSMYDIQLKLIATTKMKGEQKEINKENKKMKRETLRMLFQMPWLDFS